MCSGIDAPVAAETFVVRRNMEVATDAASLLERALYSERNSRTKIGAKYVCCDA